jgi:hypothetical protein
MGPRTSDSESVQQCKKVSIQAFARLSCL